ncbi:hypothetical protein C2E23DRAFT_884289 [Lenzites betulinus]|nr:hypothetical protein C2E23DRAFT_884289 [Lenzites betulinus]
MPGLSEWKAFIPQGLEQERCVPKPRLLSYRIKPGWNNCLAAQMRLASNRKELRIYCKLVAKIAKRSDKYATSVRRIDPREPKNWHRWLTFVERITDELPILKAYEDAWPVTAIAQPLPAMPKGLNSPPENDVNASNIPDDEASHEPDTSDEDSRSSSNASDSGDSGVATPSTHRQQQPTPPHSTDEGRDGGSSPSSASRSGTRKRVASRGSPGIQIRDGTNSSTTHVHPIKLAHGRQFFDAVCIPPYKRSCVSTPDALAPSKSASAPGPGPGPARTSIPQASASASAPVPSSSSPPTSTNPVLAFLCALCPAQDALLPVLAQKGVTDGAQLRGLARMPAARRKALLNAWLREDAISELQFAALEAGLAGVARAGEMVRVWG